MPANYGGFESLVENLIGNSPSNIKYTVFCSGKDMPDKRPNHKGADLKYIPLQANGFQSIPYDILSLCRCIRGYDVLLVLGVSGCMFLPIFRLLNRKKLIVNIDGLEHRREKWGKLARWVLRTSEAMAIRFADIIIADNKGIQDYITRTYHQPSELIAYGGDHAQRHLSDDFIDNALSDYGLIKGNYAVTVCRIEPENNSHVILDAFAHTDRTLVFIGNWNHSEYSRSLKEKYSAYPNIKIVDAIYNLDVLYAIRSNAGVYMHGHSAGGTNPSLVEAMFFGIPIIAYDVVYNRESTFNKAYYFNNSDDIINLLDQPVLSGGESMKTLAEENYRWRDIAHQYVRLYR